MRDKTARPSKAEYGVLLALLLLALIARLLPGPRTVDDAYITFRYARNLLAGKGFVYNPGEQVLGTTTPLYTLLLAGLAGVIGWREFPTLAIGINALAGGASVLLLYFLARRFSGQRAVGAAAALLWAIAPYSVSFAIGGMETDLTIALILAAFLAHLTNKNLCMAICAALAFLARPDTLIATGPLFLDLLLVKRRIPWREVGVTMGLLAPWLLFATVYFGSPLPSSLAAKSITYRLPPTADLVRLLQHFATPFFESNILPPLGIVLAFGLYVGLCLLGGWSTFRNNRRTWPITLYPLSYAAVFAIANPLLFRWYLSPPLPIYFLLILTGFWKLAHDVGRLVNGKLGVGRRMNRQTQSTNLLTTDLLFALFALLALIFTLNAWVLHPDHGPDRPAPEMAWFQLEQLYAQAADRINAMAQEGETLCAGDIGVLGYRTRMHILDTVGLVTPESSNYYPADPAIYEINYAIPADLVLALDPDYIVILEVYGRHGLLPDPRFQDRYQRIDNLETNIYGSEGMLVFGRR